MLWDWIVKIWTRIPVEFLNNIFDVYPLKLKAVIDCGGRQIARRDWEKYRRKKTKISYPNDPFLMAYATTHSKCTGFECVRDVGDQKDSELGGGNECPSDSDPEGDFIDLDEQLGGVCPRRIDLLRLYGSDKLYGWRVVYKGKKPRRQRTLKPKVWETTDDS